MPEPPWPASGTSPRPAIRTWSGRTCAGRMRPKGAAFLPAGTLALAKGALALATSPPRMSCSLARRVVRSRPWAVHSAHDGAQRAALYAGPCVKWSARPP